MRQTAATYTTLTRCAKVLGVFADAESATARQVLRAIDAERFSDLFDGTIGFPSLSATFPLDYCAYNLLRKYPFQGVDRKAAALRAFALAEAQCRETNARLPNLFRTDRATRDAIWYLREKIQGCLGPFDWNAVEPDFAWGPGATTRLANSEGDVYYKFRGKPETTLQNLPLAIAAYKRIPLWIEALVPTSDEDTFKVVGGSKVTTVPKDAKTDRTIAIEPCMNMYVQKGIGTAIRRRLRRVGVDLNDQSFNQSLAKVAYDRGLATVDLSAASDTVSYKLVDLLLPDDWLSALKQCRSPGYVLDSRFARFEKFSTMGNGYTFELESLIFWAITSLAVDETFVADRTIGIYGDDIICHEYSVERLFHWLSVFGFSVNESKSFWSGAFRESCGKHYFHGRDVTPVFVKDRIDHPDRSAWFANSIARWGERAASNGFRRVAEDSWLCSQEFVPEAYRLPIPNGVGDGGLVVPRMPSFRIPEDLRAGPRCKPKYSISYQGGFDYMHNVRVEEILPDRDPTDVPYLLRALYRMKDQHPNSLSYLDPHESRIEISRAVKVLKRRGWSSSWETPSFS